MKLLGEEHRETLLEASNYADSLHNLKRFEEAKSLLHRTVPVARRVIGEGHRLTLTMRSIYAEVLYKDASSTLGDLRESVETLEDTARTARRVLGGAHPTVAVIELSLRDAQAALGARETQDAFRTARVSLAQERSELARTLADASARPSRDA